MRGIRQQRALVLTASTSAASARFSFRATAAVALCLIALGASWIVVIDGSSPHVGPASIPELWKLISSTFPPNLSFSFLTTVAVAVLQTLALAIASTALSIAIGLPLGILSAPLFWNGETLSHSTVRFRMVRRLPIMLLRVALAATRAVPDLMWALLFVAAFGLGSPAGVLALAITYSASLGRIYADVFDAVPAGPVDALRASGATRVQAFIWGMWPQALPNVTAYTLYSFECTIRAASILGFVGAGGLGQELALSVRLFRYDEVLTIMGAFAALTLLSDRLSALARLQLNGDGVRSAPCGAPCAEAPAARFGSVPRLPAILRWRLGWLLIAVVIAASFAGTDLGSAVLQASTVGWHAVRFIGSCYPPDFTADFAHSLLRPLLETIAISVLGTTGGIGLAIALTPPATAALMQRSSDEVGHTQLLERAARSSSYLIARSVLCLLRAVPDIAWVAICVVVVGFGPLAGTVAVALHTGGVLGRLYAEALEEAPREPVNAIRNAGATGLQLLLWGLYSQVKPLLASYTMLRWEANLRACTILGLVGGGGLGQAIYQNVQLGFYQRVTTLVLLVVVLVVLTDRLSEALRTRLQYT
jgi:phosphonate transport system permease protein